MIQLGSGGLASRPTDDGKAESNVAPEGRDQLPDLVAEIQDARGCTRVRPIVEVSRRIHRRYKKGGRDDEAGQDDARQER